MTPDLSIVVVNWNTRDLLRACLASLPAATGGLNYEVIVVDNGSSDDSVAMVRREFPGVILLEPGENLGFARANNLAFARVSGDAVVLLNPDTVCHPNSLRALRDRLRVRADAAAAGPLLLDADGAPTISYGNFPAARYHWLALLGPLRRWLPPLRGQQFTCVPAEDEEERPVDYVAGACLLIPRRILAEIGTLDERYFMYFEETDWCWRAQAAGRQVYYCPAARVHHFEGRSAARVSRFSRAQLQQSYRLFVAKNYGPQRVAAFRAAQFCEYSAKALARATVGLFAARHRPLARSYWQTARLQLARDIAVEPPRRPERPAAGPA